MYVCLLHLPYEFDNVHVDLIDEGVVNGSIPQMLNTKLNKPSDRIKNQK